MYSRYNEEILTSSGKRRYFPKTPLICFSLVWFPSFKAVMNLLNKGAFLGAKQIPAESLNLTFSQQPERQPTSAPSQGVSLGTVCWSTPRECLACNVSICSPAFLVSVLHTDIGALQWGQTHPALPHSLPADASSHAWGRRSLLQPTTTTRVADSSQASGDHGLELQEKVCRRESQPWPKITPLFRGRMRGGIPSEEFHAWKVRQVSWKGFYLEQTNPSAGWALFFVYLKQRGSTIKEL